MVFALTLPAQQKKQGWKVKIQSKESRESPHCTIWFKKKRWRVNLRTGALMDGASWKDIHEEVRKKIDEEWDVLCREWDRMYGDVNPISSEENDDEEA